MEMSGFKKFQEQPLNVVCVNKKGESSYPDYQEK
jgi:hypothetical protein